MVPLTRTLDKAPAPVRRSWEATDAEKLEGWLQRGARERFLVETLVTPELAALLLEGNESNRTLSLSAVETYAAAMRRGEWRINGQNIIIASDGRLNDGQTRLHEVIEAAVPVPMALQFGVERESRLTLDVDRKRTLGDHFHMAALPNSNLLAAVVRLCWCYDNNYRAFSANPSVEQAFDYLKDNPGVADFLGVSGSVGTQFKCGGALFGFAAYVCSRVSHPAAKDLLERVHDGLGLASTGAPAFRVRERLLQHASNQRPLAKNEAAAVYIRAFNAAVGRRKCRALAWSSVGPKAEPFPAAGE